MWKHMARIIGEVRPRYAFIENSPMLVVRGLDRVLSDLASMGYDAEYGIISAADCGAPHLRERIWIVAKRCGLSPHAEHNWTGWREQQQESTEETATDGNANSNSKPAFHKHDETQWLSDVADTSIKGLQRGKETRHHGENREEPGYKQPA
jgi:DNA (cytosine-5)-methyltransferase 1